MKVLLALFGGTPARGEICMLLNCAAGIYGDHEFHCYPIDKDTKSPNYTECQALYNQYKEFRDCAGGRSLDMAEVVRAEELFEEMLHQAGIRAEEESIERLLSGTDGFSDKERRLLDICFTRTEQEQNLSGGYYGKANIGAVTGDLLIYQGVYQMMEIYHEIETGQKKGHDMEVIILCSSFGGTGASLGINFGEYLDKAFPDRSRLRLHCIHIQPYFSFPDPEEEDEWQMDYKKFYAKSATIVNILGQKTGFIKNGEGDKAVFDSFYYLGQEVLDQISDKNSARDEQKDRLHIIDMLVSLAVADILSGKREEGRRLYGYQYERKGTDFLSWIHMPARIGFKDKHVHFMRFCAFMLECMEPIFLPGFQGYEQEKLIVYLYGKQGAFHSKADIQEETDVVLREKMLAGCRFCRKYMQYWLELERTTRYGKEEDHVTRFFNIKELERILGTKGRPYIQIREAFDPDLLTQVDAYQNYPAGAGGLDIYDGLCRVAELKRLAAKSGGREVAGSLMDVIYRLCRFKEK